MPGLFSFLATTEPPQLYSDLSFETVGSRNPCRPWRWSLCSSFLSLRDLWAPGTRAGLGDSHRAQALPFRDLWVPGTRAALGDGLSAQALSLRDLWVPGTRAGLGMVAALKLYPLETGGRLEPVSALRIVAGLKAHAP